MYALNVYRRWGKKMCTNREKKTENEQGDENSKINNTTDNDLWRTEAASGGPCSRSRLNTVISPVPARRVYPFARIHEYDIRLCVETERARPPSTTPSTGTTNQLPCRRRHQISGYCNFLFFIFLNKKHHNDMS